MATSNITTNVDIDYIASDFFSVQDALIAYATTYYGANTEAGRLWTDFNQSSFSRTWLELLAYISDVFFFYFSNQATQTYLQTATVQSAIADIAKQFGYSPATATSASGLATFTVTGAVTIPRGFKVSSTNGIPFYLTNDIIATSAGNWQGTVLQGTIAIEQFTAKGLQNEVFVLKGPNVVKDLTNLNSADISPQVVINGNNYTLVDTFVRNNGTDAPAVVDSLGEVVGGGGRVFELGVNNNNTPTITFGDGVFGRKLNPGELITVIYRTGGGSSGNIPVNTLINLIDTNTSIASVTNSAQFSGGADAQTISQLRDLIPQSLRTLDRAVALQDYPDLLTSNFTQVLLASADISNLVGVDLNIYVVPQGNGITNITSNVGLLNTLTNFIDRRKPVTTQFQIKDAFGISILIEIEVYISKTASQSNVKNSINTALTNYFNLITGGSNGSGIGFSTPILSEDINSILKNISGIDRFDIVKLTYRPRIDNEVLGLTTSYRSTEVSIFPNVERVEWLVGAAGLAGGPNSQETFKVFKKIQATVSNFSVNSITDSTLDFSILNSTGNSLSSTVLLDNTKTFVTNSFSSGAYYLVDAAQNIWNISSNTNNTITVSSPAVNNGSVTALTDGNYSIVTKFTGYNILFNGVILPVGYNNKNTFFSIGGQFNQIGTIGNSFQISKFQTNIGSFGYDLNILSYNPITKVITASSSSLTSVSDITGLNEVIDNTGQIFNVTSINQTGAPTTILITVNSNLTPAIGNTAILSKRYYDDNNEISFILGVSSGSIISATDVNEYGKGTVSGNPNKPVDTFIFRTSPYNDDIINLRSNEIPQISTSDIIADIFGGVS